MSSPAQGAVGAARVCHKEQMEVWTSEIAGDLSMGGWFREDISYDDKLAIRDTIAGNIRSIVGTAFDLATPRTDSDEGTVGVSAVAQALRAADWGGVSIGNKALIAAAISELEATPAPATPPGVPDSVRALSEAMKPFAEEADRYDPPENDDGALLFDCARSPLRLRHLRAARSAYKTLLSAHPAGQSTGQGADVAAYLRDLDRVVTTPPSDPRLDTRVGPAGPAAGLDGYGSQARPLSPAPVSTRTGDEGTERLREAVSKALHDNQFADGWPEMVDPVVAAVLAARPAAPEAQGAWRERAATEIDAIAQQWGTEGDADGRAYAKTLAAILRAEQPAPPSSGQGER